MPKDSLHKELKISKGDFFIKFGQPNYRVGQIIKGILRGFTINNNGEEATTHFYMEGDLVSGNYIPNIPATMNIQALEDCVLSAANYKEVFSHINSNKELTEIMMTHYQKLNKQNHSRVEALISGDAMTKYKWFLNEYPNLLNRVPHYYIASFLGITPTQLSRTRKTFSQQM